MSIDVQTCGSCAATWFPLRLLCPRCGAAELGLTPVDDGVLEESTTLRDGVALGTVALPGGPRVVARLHGDVSRGDRIALSHDSHDERRPVAFVPAGSTERTLHE